MKRSPQEYRQLFLKLREDIFRELGHTPDVVEETEKNLAIQYLDLSGVRFSIVHELNASPEEILIQCHLGEIPEKRKNDVLLQLLNLNRQHYLRGQDIVLGIEDEDDEAVYAYACKLEDATGQGVYFAMSYMAIHARGWSRTYFLDEKVEISLSPSMMIDMYA